MEEHVEDDPVQANYVSAKEAFNQLEDLWELYVEVNPEFITQCFKKDIEIEDIVYSTLEPEVCKLLYH